MAKSLSSFCNPDYKWSAIVSVSDKRENLRLHHCLNISACRGHLKSPTVNLFSRLRLNSIVIASRFGKKKHFCVFFRIQQLAKECKTSGHVLFQNNCHYNFDVLVPSGLNI